MQTRLEEFAHSEKWRANGPSSWGKLCAEYDESKKLSLRYYLEDSESIEKKGLLGGLCSLISGKGHSRLLHLEFRELESYLRTENHIPSFSSSEEAQSFFNECREDLLKYLCFEELQREKASSTAWSESFVANLRLLNDLFQKVIGPVSGEFGQSVELVALEKNEVVIGVESVENWFFLALQSYLRQIFCKNELYVVAEK